MSREELIELNYVLASRHISEKANGIQTAKNIDALLSFGHKITLLTPRKPLDKYQGVNYQTYYNVRRFPIYRLPIINIFPFTMNNERLERLAYLLETISFLFVLLIYQTIKPRTFYIRNYAIAAMMSYIIPSKIIFEVHSLPTGKSIISKKQIRRISKFIPLTSSLAKILEEDYGIEKSKILIAPSAVSLIDFQSNNRGISRKLNGNYERKDTKVVLGYVGKFEAKGYSKGVENIIRALKFLPDMFTAILVGVSPKNIKKYEEILINEEINSERVEIITHRPYSEIIDYYAHIDILVLPSLRNDFSSIFSSPLKLFEYMSMGKPIISSDLPPIRDILDDDACYYVEPGNSEDIANAARAIFADSELATDKVDKAYKILANHTWEARAKKISPFINPSPSQID